jgi:hypothetical protein
MPMTMLENRDHPISLELDIIKSPKLIELERMTD